MKKSHLIVQEVRKGIKVKGLVEMKKGVVHTHPTHPLSGIVSVP